MDEKTSYWLELAEYDLETARAMLETGRYLYVGFMCHQVVEKALKAVIASAGAQPPYIHNLSKLAELSGLYERLDDRQKDLIDGLESLNVQARYPEEKERIFRTLSPDYCRRLLVQTEELFQWIRATL
ncbi:MAG: HEPN domain-containing protein [Armatimonadetes bacterium]|nr:HEPN domain-containing protein [Armatimonadota bacterium]